MRFILILLFSVSLYSQEIITEENFSKKLEHDIVVVEFYAEWNKGNCVDLSEFKDVATYMVNIDNSPDLKSNYKIISVPTIIIFTNKEAAYRFEADLTFQLSIKEPKKKVEELVLKKFM
tara:strand:- start:2058 stop:2414 length:357 start_codon:yes stop_codon:yes gene_type:complete